MNDHSNQPLDSLKKSGKAATDESLNIRNPGSQYTLQLLSSYIYCACKSNPASGSSVCSRCGKKKLGVSSPGDSEELYKFSQHVGFAHYVKNFEKILNGSSGYAGNRSGLREEQLYDQAIAVLSKSVVSGAEIKSAINALSSIPDYKDSKTKISELEKMLDEWNIKKEQERKEYLYTKALSVLNASSVTESDLKSSIGELNSIADYKNSVEKIKELEARLEKLYADRAAAIAAEKRRREIRKAKAKKITIISSTVAALIALVILGINYATTPFGIAYDLAGGTLNGYNESSYTLLTDDIALKAPTKDGYTFIGWTGTDLETPTVDVTISKWSAGEREYIANWKANDYTIKFNVSGGIIANSTQNVTFDANVKLPTPTRTGYTFDGWYVGDKLYSDGEWKDTSDLTLTAKWTAKQYTITFDDVKEKDVVVTYDYNYIDSTATTVTLYDGDTLSYPTIPSRTNYVFTGWYTDSSCTTKYDFTGTVSENMTLYAGWIDMSTSSIYSAYHIDPAQYSSSSNAKKISTDGTSSSNKIHMYVTAQESGTHYIYYKNSSSSSSYKYYLQIYNLTTGTTIFSNSTISSTYYNYVSFNCSAGDVIVISVYKYSTSSSYYSTAYFYFEGFGAITSNAVASTEKLVFDEDSTYSEAVTFGENYTLPTLSMTGYTFLGWYNGETKFESGVWNIASDITLAPKWEATKNTITLDPNGGTVANTTIAVTYGEEYTLPMLERTGYTFDGWFSGTTQYTSGTWNEESDVTLVAKWTANQYTVVFDNTKVKDIVVTYNYNYSGSSNTVIELSDGDILSYPAVPTRSGYAFVGWYTDSSCTIRFNFTETITENITLYAKWYAMTSSYNVREYVNIANYNTSSYKKTFSNVTSSSYKNYYYFTTYKTGTYTFYTYYSSGDYYISVYNATQGTSILSNTNMWSGNSSSKYVSYTANAGDIIYVCVYKYSSSSSTGSGSFYVSGASYPTSTAKAEYLGTDVEYGFGDSITVQATFGEEFMLPTLTRSGYTFLGWYNGDTKVESGIWNYDTNVTLTPRWE